MSQREEQLQAMRRAVTVRAAELGVTIQRLPSGVYHLRGTVVDLKVLDLADVHGSDLDNRA